MRILLDKGLIRRALEGFLHIARRQALTEEQRGVLSLLRAWHGTQQLYMSFKSKLYVFENVPVGVCRNVENDTITGRYWNAWKNWLLIRISSKIKYKYRVLDLQNTNEHLLGDFKNGRKNYSALS
jgi:hypothetical protein